MGMTATIKVPFYEHLIENIRYTRQQAQGFRTQAHALPDDSLREQWNDFCREAEALHKEVTALGGLFHYYGSPEAVSPNPEQK